MIRPHTDTTVAGLIGRIKRRQLLRVGFLNPQQPDRALDELLQLPRRGRATKREVEMMLAAIDQIARNVR